MAEDSSGRDLSSNSSLSLSSLESSDTKVYAPYIRARLGTAAHLSQVCALKLGDHRIVEGRGRQPGVGIHGGGAPGLARLGEGDEVFVLPLPLVCFVDSPAWKRVSGFGFRVSGFRASGFGFQVSG
jgi:hypothetical protein